MCKNCGPRVQAMSKSSGREYILYAALGSRLQTTGYKRGLSTNHAQLPTPYFSTQKTCHSPQLYGALSTQYTVPITITTNHITK